MKCREAEGQLSGFLDENVSKELHRRIKTHLRGCKRCQSRLSLLKKERVPEERPQERNDLKKGQPSLPVALSPISESDAVSFEPPVFQKSASSLRFMPALNLAMAVLVVGGIYFFTQGSAGTEMTSLVDQTPILLAGGSAPEENPAREANKAPQIQTPPAPNVAAESEIAPTIKKAGNGKPDDLLPKKAGNERGHNPSKRVSQKPRPTGPPVKVLLISRDLKEAVGAIQARAAQLDGKVLEKKGGDSAARFILLLPAAQYEPFFQSLQELGLAKKTSKKDLSREGSLKVEVTIE